MATLNRILVWYRNDLRLHDHEPLHQAIAQGAEVIPVYCFDPRHFGETSFGFAKTGGFRAQFLWESVADLRANLQAIEGDLVIRVGKPEEVLPQLVEQLGVKAVHYHQEVTAEETGVETKLKAALAVPCQSYWGHTLYLPEDLPFAIGDLPELFTAFRKAVEQQAGIEEPLPAPGKLKPFSGEVDRGEMPSLAELGVIVNAGGQRGVLAFQGGETAGKARLQDYFWDQDCLKSYKETRNGMLGANYSSKFSPWLAVGCLSPRYINAQVEAYESDLVRNDSTYWMIFELLWRDYFRFICAKHGSQIFQIEGLQGTKLAWKIDWPRFELWRSGMTGFPLIDANMRELATTGFMSNRGRQNVASFLTKNLGINWLMGAEYFESMLIDYDVCSNWGNWNYSAGVANNTRGFRWFNITKQAKDYDPQGDYVKYWCPELVKVPASRVHEPWKLSVAEQRQFGIRLGVNYPNPVVDLFKSAEANEKAYESAFGRSMSPPKKQRSR
jgi:deoxyribodipyrimidine photo-lyase